MSTHETWVPFEERPVKMVRRPHAMNRRIKRFPWVICSHCGLVSLNNESTRKAMREGCEQEVSS